MDVERIKKRIVQIAESPKNVRFDEFTNLLDNHVAHLYANFNHRDSGSHHAFTVGSQTFNIAKPHGGGCVKKVYVEKFLGAMEELGLYDLEEQP
ncbi:MAG: hypothetical protein ACRD2O_09400 [Terriglobia bacterium]